jgi:hypothetical protein
VIAEIGCGRAACGAATSYGGKGSAVFGFSGRQPQRSGEAKVCERVGMR